MASHHTLIARTHTAIVLRQLRAAGSLPPPRRRQGRVSPPQQPHSIVRDFHTALRRELLEPMRTVMAPAFEQIVELLRQQRAQEEQQTAALEGLYRPRQDADPEGPDEDLPGEEPPVVAPSVRELHQMATSVERDLAMASEQGRRAAAVLDQASRDVAAVFRPSQLHDVVRHFGRATDRHSREQLDRQLRQAIGVPISAIEKPHRDRIEEWAALNVDRIRTVPERFFDRLRIDVEEAFSSAMHPDTLAEQLADRYDIADNDAERIARDQTLKLSADLNHARMESLGVDQGIWRTNADNRVCDVCFEREGQTFDLSSGIEGQLPGDCHPGDRCWTEPVLSGILGDAE